MSGLQLILRWGFSMSGSNRGIVWDDQPLGREPDRAIARRLGVNRTTVARARRARGVRAFGAEPNGTPVDLPPVAAPQLEEWIAGTGEANGEWQRWESGARSEIQEVIRRNDAMPEGHKFIPARLMVDRLRDAWCIETTVDVLETFARRILGRGGGWLAR